MSTEPRGLELVARVFVLIGFVGFAVCWTVGWTAQGRILGRSEFERQTAERPLPIQMKGKTFFVEKDYDDRFVLANDAIGYFWLLGACGMIIANQRQLFSKLRQRKK